MAALMLAAFILMIIGYIGVFFGKLIKSAVSRQREFLADASAVQFTREPSGLAGALAEIGGACAAAGAAGAGAAGPARAHSLAASRMMRFEVDAKGLAASVGRPGPEH